MFDFLFLLPEFCLLGGILCSILFIAFSTNKKNKTNPCLLLALWIEYLLNTIIFCFLALFCFLPSVHFGYFYFWLIWSLLLLFCFRVFLNYCWSGENKYIISNSCHTVPASTIAITNKMTEKGDNHFSKRCVNFIASNWTKYKAYLKLVVNNFLNNLQKIKNFWPRYPFIPPLIFWKQEQIECYSSVSETMKRLLQDHEDLTYLAQEFRLPQQKIDEFFFFATTRHNLSFYLCNNFIVLDYYTLFLKILVAGTASFVLSQSAQYIKNHPKPLLEYPVIILLTVFFIFVLISSMDLIVSFIGVIGFSLNIYVLILNDSFNQSSREAAIKYYYLSVFSSGLLAFGILLVYLIFLDTNFIDLSWMLHVCDFKNDVILLNAMLYFIIFGFLFKLAAFPCHLWAVDVYEGSSLPVMVLFIVPIKIGVLGFFFKLLCFVFKDLYNEWVFIIWFSSFFSMTVGCLGALIEKKVKKFIAYSSINQIGFLLLGVICGTFDGMKASVLYLIIYVIMNLGLFLILLNTYDVATQKQIKFLTDFHFFAKNNWTVSISLAVILFSMSGIPPLAGFFGKYYLFFNVFLAKYYSLVIIGMLTSLISTYYYLKIIKLMWFIKQPFVKAKFITRLNAKQLYLLCFIESFLIFFCFWNDFILNLLNQIVFCCLVTK